MVGKNKDLVMQEFENLQFILKEIDSLLIDQAKGVEAVITVNIFDKHVKPDVHLTRFALPQINNLSEKFTANFVMDNFTLRSKNDHHLTTVHIAPLYRDRRYFYMQLHVRTDNPEEVFRFVEKQETYIKYILAFLSKDE